MKKNYSRIGLAKLCGWFGITRQAYYQNSWKAIEVGVEEALILKEVKRLRKNNKNVVPETVFIKFQDQSALNCFLKKLPILTREFRALNPCD
jgi:hypothetical protein